MMLNHVPYEIYLEIGKKKTFACSLAWPGWCRSGSGEMAAIQALSSYASRYAEIVKNTDLEFILPGSVTDFIVRDRIEGNASTDFGVPNLPIPGDTTPLSDGEIQKSIKILKASWLAFDKAAQLAEGKQLRKGPRGGGRELVEIINHVAMAENYYLRRLGYTVALIGKMSTRQTLEKIRRDTLNGINIAVHGQLPEQGHHGGKRWPLPYFTRRVAWHVVDHAWEIEDRIV
jgi:hypothetical protein